MNSIAQLITDLVEAYAEERDARRGYDGGSWGYHGHRLISARAEAETALIDGLNELIDQRIAEALEARKS